MSNMQGKAMRRWFLAVAILVAFLCNPSEGGEYGELRMDFDLNYFTYQDIEKVFKGNGKLWLYGTNYKHEAEGGAHCIYFQADSFPSGGLNFTYNKRVGEEWKHVPHAGTYIKEEDATNRPNPNSMSVLKSPGNPDVRTYRLIFDGRKGCYVFRVPGQHDGRGCMVLLTDKVVSNGIDPTCQSMYDNACGRTPPYIKVFDESCKNGVPNA